MCYRSFGEKVIHSISLSAFAKINVGLKITNRLPNGYHCIHSLFQEINLNDTVDITRTNSQNIDFSASGLDVPEDSSNLCVKSANYFCEKFGITEGFHIHLEKRIPIGSGLGGGSSDAAATLIGLRTLTKINISDNQMIKLSAKIGADVPFFINGGLQLAENIGDKLTPIKEHIFKDYIFVLVKPNFDISTSWAYSELRKTLQLDKLGHKFAPILKPIKWQLFENDFEKVILPSYPEVGRIKQVLIEHDALHACLSGSGSTVFGVFHNNETALKAVELLPSYQTFLTLPKYRHL